MTYYTYMLLIDGVDSETWTIPTTQDDPSIIRVMGTAAITVRDTRPLNSADDDGCLASFDPKRIIAAVRFPCPNADL